MGSILPASRSRCRRPHASPLPGRARRRGEGGTAVGLDVRRGIASGLDLDGHVRGSELGYGARELLPLLDRLAVPALLVLHEGDALALEGAGHDPERPPRAGARLGEGRAQRLDIVAVHGDRVPAERHEAGLVVAGLVLVHRGSALAQAVHVHDRAEVVEAVEGGELRGLPHRALRGLPVPEERVDAALALIELATPGHPRRRAQPLAERARGHPHPGRARRRDVLRAGCRTGAGSGGRRRSPPLP